MVLAARRARNLDGGFSVVNDPQVADASRRMGLRVTGYSLLMGLLFAGLVAAIPIG